jgi:hypothetical protein
MLINKLWIGGSGHIFCPYNDITIAQSSQISVAKYFTWFLVIHQPVNLIAPNTREFVILRWDFVSPSGELNPQSLTLHLIPTIQAGSFHVIFYNSSHDN